jgi:hypothetical protein
MKHLAIFLTLALLMLLQPARAQQKNSFQKGTYFGIHGSPTVYLPRWKLHNETATIQPLVGFMTGFSFQYNFSKRFELHWELNYEEIKYHTLAKVTDDIIYQDVFIGNMFLLPMNTTHRIQYLSLPISLKFNMIKRERFAFFLNAGINWSAVLGEEITTTNYYTGKEIELMQVDRNEKYLGGLAGLGADFALTKRIHLFTEARDYFFNRLLQETDPHMELTEHSFRFILGLTYRINK